MSLEHIDDLARALPPYRPEASRAEQVRTAVLAASAGVARSRPSSRRFAYAIVAAAAVAAAAGVLWKVTRPAATPEQVARADRRATVTPIGEARYELGAIALDEVVRAHDGRLRVTVETLIDGERFRLVTGDGELETRGGGFEVELRMDHLQSVVCSSGQIEVRPEHGEVVLLDAGERWDAPDRAVAPPPAPEPPVPTAVDPPAPAPGPPKRTPKVQRSGGSVATPVKPPVDAPGEAEFRAGWAALKAGDPEKAADSFAAARQVKGTVLAEDASFWEGIALARAGKASKAIAALRRFVSKYSSSSRSGEAQAKLGWLLYDAGELDAAERHFEAAVDDRVPKVQKSARDGLEAIARRRGAE